MALLVSVVSSAAPAVASRDERYAPIRLDAPLIRAERVKRAVLRRGASLLKGTVIDGPKHLLTEIKEHPFRYALILGGIGAFGAGAKMAGIEPEPFLLGLSAGTYAWSAHKHLPELRATGGTSRFRKIGAHLVWPLALLAGTTAAGGLVRTSLHADANLTLHDAGASGAHSMVAGADSPTTLHKVFRRKR